MKEKPIIVFDDSVKSKVIKALGYTENENSELVDKKGKVVTSQNFEKISSDEFGGVLSGSRIPIKNNESELVKFFVSGK